MNNLKFSNNKIRDGTVIYPCVTFGEGFTTGHFAVIRENNVFGDNCSIGTHSQVGPGCIIGNNVRVHSTSFIGDGTVIEDNVWIGAYFLSMNCENPNVKCPVYKRVHIKQGAVIGSDVKVFPGVTIGKNAFVGGGSRVYEDVPDNAFVIGHPAQFVRYLTEEELAERKYNGI